MDTIQQNAYRKNLIEKYEQRAFECLALYNYYGRQYSDIDKQCGDFDERIKKAEKEIVEINDKPDHHTVENRKKVTALKNDIMMYKKRIDGVGDIAKNFMEKAAGYREEGVRALEIVEEFKAFTLKTPEEIEAAKKAPVAEPVVAGEDKK